MEKPWDIELHERLLNAKVVITTGEGGRREGVITSINYREVSIAGAVIEVPTGLVLDGEDIDIISIHTIENVEINDG